MLLSKQKAFSSIRHPNVNRGLKLVFFFFLLFGLTACGSQWGWHVVDLGLENGRLNLLYLLNGYVYTITMSLAAIFFSITGGFVLSLIALSKRLAIRTLNIGLVELLRSVPPLVMILWVYYGLPIATGVNLSIFWAGVISLTLVDVPFMSEIYRSGIQAIASGQSEASKSLGLSYFQSMRLVILPQAIRRILPSMANQFILILKTSSLISIIGYPELTRRSNELATLEQRSLEIYTVLIMEYLVLVLFLSLGVRLLEKRLGRFY